MTKPKIILYLAILVGFDLSAMTQVARKSPALTRTALVAARTGTEGLAAARAGIARSRLVAENAGLVRARSTLSMPKNQVTGQPYNRTFKQEQAKRFVQNPKVIAAALGTAAVGLAVIAEATGIADKVQGLYNMAMFDQDLISDEFSNAIVRIYSGRETENGFKLSHHGSAFIVRSDQNPDCYFVITAAHCLGDQEEQIIQMNYPKLYTLLTEPIIIDRNNDIAILLIAQTEIKKFKDEFGDAPSAIPVQQLSSIRPELKEIVSLQGYPGITAQGVPGIYKKKFITEGFPVWPGYTINYRDIPIERLFTWFPKDIRGTSGGPIIAIRNKKPEVVGIHAMGDELSGRQALYGRMYAAGVGKLPEYLQEAEKIQQKKEEEIKKMAKSKTAEAESWLDYFKRTIWGK